jgi:hypothetical protein
MAKLPFDRAQVEAFFEAVGNTNFQVIARGSSYEGGARGEITKKRTYYNNCEKDEIYETRVKISSGSGQDREFSMAMNAAKGNDFLRVLAILIDSHFYQVEITPLTYIDRPALQGSTDNPYAKTVEPLVWTRDIETNIIHQRPLLHGNPILIDLPDKMILDLDREAERKEIKRVQLIRSFIAEGLKNISQEE